MKTMGIKGCIKNFMIQLKSTVSKFFCSEMIGIMRRVNFSFLSLRKNLLDVMLWTQISIIIRVSSILNKTQYCNCEYEYYKYYI